MPDSLDKSSLTEADICDQFVTPAVVAAGWDQAVQVRREFTLSAWRMIVRGQMATRGESRRADYVLSRRPGIPLAVIEAKDATHAIGAGMPQALEYAERLGVPFAFSSNSDGFLFHNRAAPAGQTETTLAHHVDGRHHERRRLRLPALRPGEYRFAMESGGGEDVQTLIVAPPRCHLPPPPRSGRHWALAVQLYGLRSARDWGHGDFSQLADLLDIGARLGAAGVGINPVHAMFPERPDHRSPYSPSDRRFLAVLYIDIEAVPDFPDCEPARAGGESGLTQRAGPCARRGAGRLCRRGGTQAAVARTAVPVLP